MGIELLKKNEAPFKHVFILPQFEDVCIPPCIRSQYSAEHVHEDMGIQRKLHARETKTLKAIEFDSHGTPQQNIQIPTAHGPTGTHLLSNGLNPALSTILITCLSASAFVLQAIL